MVFLIGHCGSRVLVLIARTGLRIDIRRYVASAAATGIVPRTTRIEIVKSKPVLVMSGIFRKLAHPTGFEPVTSAFGALWFRG
jgi:hypothetical protein